MSWFTDDNATRKRWPIWDYMFGYFPLAWLEEVRVSAVANEQHNPGEKMHWDRTKSTDQLNTAMRHQFDYAKAKAAGVTVPRDSKGMAVLAQAVWRLKAQLQLDLEEEQRQQASVPIPSPLTGQGREAKCACGAMTFKGIREGELPPSVLDPKTGCTHTELDCFWPLCKCGKYSLVPETKWASPYHAPGGIVHTRDVCEHQWATFP